ncbi:MAG TPA: hypothetical protein VKP67_04610 [Xanthobacteraceae bacterium]|nr:hypothetical protein [Xanthobacteraceae bacterium]
MIEIDSQDSFSLAPFEIGRKVSSDRRFADAALKVGHEKDGNTVLELPVIALRLFHHRASEPKIVIIVESIAYAAESFCQFRVLRLEESDIGIPEIP